jgi:hypothetical protein
LRIFAKSLIFVLLLCIAFGGCSDYLYEGRPAKFIPRFNEKSIPKGFSFDGNTIVYSDSKSEIKVKFMDSADVDLFFLKHDLKNPFLEAPEMRDAFTLFHLTFTNGSEGVMRFNPRRASIYVGGSYFRGSLDYTEVLMIYRKFADELDATVFKKSMYDTDIEIEPGSSIEGLLIFPLIPKGTKKIVVLLESIFMGGTHFTIPYEFEEK